MTPSNDLTARSRLRSAQWYAGDDRNAYVHRAWMRRGVPGDAFTGRPHIAIANIASDLTPCNAHLTEVAASVKNGASGQPDRRRCVARRLRQDHSAFAEGGFAGPRRGTKRCGATLRHCRLSI
jgi:hypothetical protein